jgi:hypothetical protein
MLLTMYQSSIYVLNYEQSDVRSSGRGSNSGDVLKNKNNFTLFHLKNLRSSLNMNSAASAPASASAEVTEERKTTVLKLTLTTNGSQSAANGSHGASSLAASASSSSRTKLSRYLTVAPSSLSYRLTGS